MSANKPNGDHEKLPWTYEMDERIWIDKLAGRKASATARKLCLVTLSKDLATGERFVDWDLRTVNCRFESLKKTFASLRDMQSSYGLA